MRLICPRCCGNAITHVEDDWWKCQRCGAQIRVKLKSQNAAELPTVEDAAKCARGT